MFGSRSVDMYGMNMGKNFLGLKKNCLLVCRDKVEDFIFKSFLPFGGQDLREKVHSLLPSYVT